MKTKIVLLSILMIGIGVATGYALWAKTLTLTGLVTTAKVDVGWSPFTDDDNGIDPGYDSDIADCSIGLDPEDPGKATIEIANGFPNYTCTINGNVHNSGNIPAILQGFVYNLPVGNVVNITSLGDFNISSGMKLEPSQIIYGGFKIRIEHAAKQDTTYKFTISLNAGFPTSSTGNVSINIRNYVFDPNTVTIANGTNVTWTNYDSDSHTITSISGIFDSGSINPGKKYSRRFIQIGTFEYKCVYHPGMVHGKIIVT